MLSKMETVYLGLLRGVILIAATIALIVAAFMIVSMVPTLLTRMGVTTGDAATNSLSDFIAEQKPQETVADEDLTVETPVDPNIAKAARNFHSYLDKRSALTVKEWEQGLQSAQNLMPLLAQAGYGTSVLGLTEELKASKGKALTEKRVLALLVWHQTRFKLNYEQREAEKAAADAAFQFQMLAVFGAIMLFVFIAFIFLFVRIERNLRVVRVENV